MNGPYFHSEGWVGRLTLTPMTWAEEATASRLRDAGASTTGEPSAPASLAPSRACPQAPLSFSPSIFGPNYRYSPGSGRGGAPTSPDNPPDPLLPYPLAHPGDHPLASPPEPLVAPIERNDPVLTSAQTVHHSIDRASLDREAMMKTIEPLSFNIRRLEEKCEEILVGIRRRDYNDYARTMNSGVRDHTTSLEPLYDLENSIPLLFSRMVGDIRRLNTADVNTLLALYGIPIQGTIAMKKRRLALFIGLSLDIDFQN